MPNVAEIIKDHVTLEVDCLDRLYLAGYVPKLGYTKGVVCFLTRGCNQPIPSPAVFERLGADFKARLATWVTAHQIPQITFEKGARKDDAVEPYRRRFQAPSGVLLVGIAQERAFAWTARKTETGRRLHFEFSRKSVFVNHYYFYLLDEQWGPCFIKVCSYAPYAIKICLNGHEWVKRQLQKRRIPFTALNNGFFSCGTPTLLQAICDSLGPDDIAAFFQRWLQRLPLPLTADHRAAGFDYALSLRQVEVSRTQVFDRPLRGREFFEQVIRENLDLGRPDQVQLLFARRIMRTTPGIFHTRVLTNGVTPSLHIDYKQCRIKQYFKESRALRTETTFNNTYDVGVRRGLSNLSELRHLGDQINRRVLETERLTHDCALAPAQWTALTQPTRTATGQPAPALRLGQPRVMALLAAICHFTWTAQPITNKQLRVLVAALLGPQGATYGARQMGYDLRRLHRKRLVEREGPGLRYHLTPLGRRIALFVTKLDARILRPGFQALIPDIPSQAPPPLRRALLAVDQAADRLIAEAKVA